MQQNEAATQGLNTISTTWLSLIITTAIVAILLSILIKKYNKSKGNEKYIIEAQIAEIYEKLLDNKTPKLLARLKWN